MLNSRHRGVRELGSFLFALLMLSSVRRTKWLVPGKRIPAVRIGDREATPPNAGDIALCARLIEAYAQATSRDDADPTQGMWSWIFDARQKGLAECVLSGDAEALAGQLSTMFRQDFVLGMAPGPLLLQARSPLASRAWGLKCLDGLASIGELLGTVAVENPEQGESGIAFREGLPSFLAATEAELGFDLDFPDVGAASGLIVDGRLITPDTPDQIYGALRLGQALALSAADDADLDPDRAAVVEIGGGYGGVCYWYLRHRPRTASYTIVDLPIVNVIQGYFLGRALGPDQVAFLGERQEARVRILPDSALPEVEAPFDVLVNKDSMPEMPREVMEDYLRWAAENCRGIFYSYNQEAAMTFLGEPQGVVHRSTSQLPNFTRLRRDRAWLRDGYVEEVYRVRGSKY